MRFEDQGAHGTALVRDLFLFGQEDGRFLGATERRIMGVRGGIIQRVGRQGGGKIQSRGHHGVLGGEPALRSQEGVAFLGTVIEDGFQIRFVGITVVLRADEGAVAPVQGWTQATNELPGHPTTPHVAGSHDPCAGTTGFRLVDDDITPPVSHWWTMTSTHKAWWAGHAIKADVGGGVLQTG